MRVLLLNYEYPPLGGGAAVATEALARGLARRGSSVEVVTAGTNDGRRAIDTRGPDVPGTLAVHRVPVRRRGVHETGLPAVVAYLRRAIPVVRPLVRRRPFAIVHVFFGLPTGALLPVLKLDRTPVVVSLRGSDVPGYDVTNGWLRMLHAAARPLTRWVWNRADRVVALSKALGTLARETVPGLEYDVIHNGVDTERFRPAPAPTTPDGPVRCIAVARLIDRKGIDTLLRAWARLERGRYRLEIVGDGPAGGRLRALGRALGLREEVTFVGPLGREATAERMRASDLFTLPPVNEAFGNVFAEALASGLPVVTTDVGGIPEFVTDGVHGRLVPPRDEYALAAAIDRLGRSVETRIRMGANARAHAEVDLSWGAMTDAYLRVYGELGAGRGAQAPGPRVAAEAS